MNKFKFLCIISVCGILFQPVHLWSAVKPKITVSDDNLINMINAQSLTQRQTEINLLNRNYVTEQFLQDYRWTLGLDMYNEKDNTKSTSSFIPLNTERDYYSLFLDKKFVTGTDFTISYIRSNTTRNTFDSNISSNKASQNLVVLSLSQNIFPTLFSAKDYLSYKSIEMNNDRISLQSKFDQFEVQKNIVDLYWKIKAIQVSVEENNFLMKKYDNLVKTIQRRKRNSTASAGELEQALAEYELRKQSLLVDKQTLDKYLIDFKTELNISQHQPLTIDPKTLVVQLPTDFKGDIQNLNRYKLQKLKASSADAEYEANKYNSYPTLDVYGEYTQSGVDPDQSESFSQMNEGDQNKYRIGVKLNYFFNNKASEAEQKYRLSLKQLESDRLSRSEDDLKNQITTLKEKLNIAYSNIKATENIVQYRLEAVRQITVNYNQGRTDINFLIDAFNKKIAAEVAAINAYGEYAKTLIEYRSYTE